jgi:hypothetical protein
MGGQLEQQPWCMHVHSCLSTCFCWGLYGEMVQQRVQQPVWRAALMCGLDQLGSIAYMCWTLVTDLVSVLLLVA